MLEDMAVRKFGDKTRHDYIRHVEAFASFLGRSPDTATADDVRRYQVHLTESGVQPPTLNSSASALRFFFATTLDRAELARHLARVHYPRKLPRVLSPEEVGRLLEAAPGPGLKYKAALSIAYGAGLRVGEVVSWAVAIGPASGARWCTRGHRQARGRGLARKAARSHKRPRPPHLGHEHDGDSADRSSRHAIWKPGW
jgi:site-specific recombinase XerD